MPTFSYLRSVQGAEEYPLNHEWTNLSENQKVLKSYTFSELPKY